MLASRRTFSRFLPFSLLLCSSGFLVLAQEANQAPKQAKEQAPTSAQYGVAAKGIVASPAVKIQFKSAPLRLEVRNLIMGRGETESIPAPTRILLELRQGAVTTTVNREKQERHQGDFWVVEKDSSFTIQNSGEVAVLRAIYIFEGSR